MSDLMTRLSHLLGSRPLFLQETGSWQKFAWRLFAVCGALMGKASGHHRETARTALQHYFYSSALIEKELNFRFTDIEETFVYICDRIKKYHS